MSKKPEVPEAKNEEEWEAPVEISEDGSGEAPAIPNDLPILPLRGVVVFPQTVIPLTVGQPRSIKMVDEVVSGERLVGLITAKNTELEMPRLDDVYRIGT